MVATVRMNGNLIDGQDGLTAVHNAVMRNKPDTCDLPIGDLIGQVRDLAVKALRDSHVYLVTFGNGDVLAFVGRLPPGVSEAAAIRAAMRQ